jgi:hypothetical protein
MATLTATPAAVRADATSLLVFLGPPNRSLFWALSGSGSLAQVAARTDAEGRAFAKYVPGSVGAVVTVSVQYGT